ncbi:response regulator transcription factor [Fredinandcohnia humi]
MRNILVVDDDKEIVDLISIYLRNEGFEVSKAYSGVEAMNTFMNKKIDLIILDIMMPDMNGLEVCRVLRDKWHVPIIMVSAKGEDIDKITGLMTGADDYLIKPFNPLELLARVKTLLRRTYQYREAENDKKQEILRVQSLEINKSAYTVSYKGSPISLTSTEFEILCLLASNPGRVFGAEELFERVWKEKYFASNNTVMVYISNLRDKLEKEMGYKAIKTVWGVGYKIEE